MPRRFGGWAFAYGADGGADAGRHGDGMADPGTGGDPPARAAARSNRRRASACMARPRGRRRRLSICIAVPGPACWRPSCCSRSSTNSARRLPGRWRPRFTCHLGFAKVEVANIGKIYGLAATLAGLALGGVVVARIGVFGALLVCGVLQMLSNLMYVVQAWAGHDLVALAADHRHREPDQRHGFGRLCHLSLGPVQRRVYRDAICAAVLARRGRAGRSFRHGAASSPRCSAGRRSSC